MIPTRTTGDGGGQRRGGGAVRGGGRGRRGGGGGGQRSRDASQQSRVIIGKKVSAGLLSMKGADLTINKYIGRVHNDVSQEDVRKFLVDQNVTVMELEQLDTKHNRFKSFRVRVKRDDLEIIEERDFWPQGILCGSFFRPKANDDRHLATGGTTASGSIVNGE